MNGNDLTCAPPERFLELVAGDLAEPEGAALLQHAKTCDACSRHLRKANRIQLNAGAWRDPPVDDITRRAMWEQIVPRAQKAARQHARSHAWRVVLFGSRARMISAAAVLLVLTVVLVALLRPTAAEKREKLWVVFQVTAPPPSSPPPPHPSSPTHDERSSVPPVVSKRVKTPALPTQKTASVPNAGPHRVAGRIIAKAQPGHLACGARILGQQGRLQVLTDLPDSAVIHLVSGSLTLRVPLLRNRHRVEVLTSDARVLVKGTRFTVRKQAHTGTVVSVAEGVVWIHPTGRNRRTVVVGPRGRAAVHGEVAYLRQVRQQIQAAVSVTDLHQVVRLARRYLSVTTQPRQSTRVRMTLAGAQARLGNIRQATLLYRHIARGGLQPVDRQNALAFLARLLRRRGQRSVAQQTWRQLLRSYPQSIHRREALLALLRASCKSKTPQARSLRRQLALHYAGDRAVQAMLRTCRPSTP